MTDAEHRTPPTSRQRALVLGLFALTIAIYARTLANDFVYYDDGLYVFDNVHVRDGFSLAGLAHIFTTGETGTWQPIALLSHMIDSAIFGLRPWGHHLSAIFLHAANATLLAIALFRLSGRFYPSLAVAAVFALHPAHVESVAWVSERKDVLSTLFWILCMLEYAEFARRRGAARYILLLVLFALGLMTKPMLVTLPCVLLLLDYWPLRRFDGGTGAVRAAIVEKLPLFVLVILSCAITLIVQRQNQAIVSLENLPLSMRLENVIVSYVKYITLMIWPAGLAIDYPHPKESLTGVQVGMCAALLGAVTAAVFAYRRSAPYVLVGWLWYLGTMVPVIGFVHVGVQGMADRYTYIPTIGLTLVVVWAIDAGLTLRPALRKPVAAGAILVFAVYAVMTWMQIAHWKNTESLWARAVAVNPANDRAQHNVAEIYIQQGRFDEAQRALELAANVNPADPRVWMNLAFIYQERGSPELALPLYAKAIELDPENVEARTSSGYCLLLLNRDAEAVEVLQKALSLRGYDIEAASNLGVALCKVGRVDDGIAVLREGVRIHPDVAKLRNNLGIALNLAGKREEAIEQFREALRVEPTFEEARRNLTALGQ